MKKEYITYNPSQTKKLGEILAKKTLKIQPKPLTFFRRKKVRGKNRAFVIGLEGDLGGGKTTFLQGFAKGLGVKQKILSPTFVIIKRFQLKNLKTYKLKNFYHIDCYRIKKPKELLDIGFKEIISNPKNIVAIEWAERIKKIIPKGWLLIKFKFINKKTRKISIIC